MFAEECRRRGDFYGRLAGQGRRFMCEENYDYFSPGDEDAVKHDDESEKESDITWNMDNDNHPSSADVDCMVENNQETENLQEKPSETGADTTEPEKTLGFWSKIRNYIKG